MKVLGIDASRSLREKPTGVERYSTEIIKAILELKPKLKIKLYLPNESSFFAKNLQRVLRCKRLWTLWGLSKEMWMHKPDALFIPSHVLPFFAHENSFTMIHDVAFMKYPEAYGRFQRFYLEWSTRRAVKNCAMIFTPTEAVAQDLELFFGAKKIKVIHHGPLNLEKSENTSEIFKKLGISKNENVFFYLGRIERKKNLKVLLEAWKILRKKFPFSKLVIGGGNGYGYEEIRSEFDEAVIAPGFLSEQEVSAMFSVATAFILPSLDEGFGMPILQAFEAGCPVICSSIPALKEIAEDAVLYGSNAKEFASRMTDLIENRELKEELIFAGKEQLKKFSWEKSAKAALFEIEKTL